MDMGGPVRFVRRYRRSLAFACAFIGVLFGLSALREEPPEWTGLVVSRDLPAGHVLLPSDVRIVDLNTAAQPVNALTEVTDAHGRVLSGPMVAGEMLLRSRLVGPGLLAGGPAGQVAMPLRLEDPAEASFLTPGDHVDVLAARRTTEFGDTGGDEGSDDNPPTAEVVARDVVVLAIPGSGSSSTAGFIGDAPAGSPSGSVLVVSVGQTQAAEIAGAAANARLSVVLRPP